MSREEIRYLLLDLKTRSDLASGPSGQTPRILFSQVGECEGSNRYTHARARAAWILPNFPYLHSRPTPETILGEVQTPEAVAAPAVTPHPYSCHFTGPAWGNSHLKPDSGPNSHPSQGPPRAARPES